ncbi:MAG: hypothetical protein JXR59_02170 [Desulfuromonadaceae bacterium]|nr:hypothetical protein [Desulfuromonadaceae bacterium]
MSSSKILRNLDAQSIRFVQLGLLDEVTEGGAGSFVAAVKPAVAQPVETVAAGAVSAAPAPSAASVEARPDVDVSAIEKQAYEEGRLAGRAEMEQQFDTTLAAFGSLSRELSALREKILQRNTGDMVQLVMAVAARVIRREVEEHEEIILQTIKRAIQAAVRAEEFHLHLHPDDLAVVQDQKPLLIAAVNGLKNIEFVADVSLGRGGCLVESPTGRVDATIETQLDEIFQAIVAGGGESP